MNTLANHNMRVLLIALGLLWALGGPVVAHAATPDVVWAPGPVLTQDRPDCVGTALATLLVSAPAPRPAPDPVTIYTAAQRWGGLAPNPRADAPLDPGLRYLQVGGWITGFARAADVPTAAAWLHAHGPVVLAGAWVQGWSWVGPDGTAGTWGPIVMRHVFVCYGTAGAWWLCQNSWGVGWGVRGRFRLAVADLPAWLAGAGNEVALVTK